MTSLIWGGVVCYSNSLSAVSYSTEVDDEFIIDDLDNNTDMALRDPRLNFDMKIQPKHK
jgi:hypothetical protein